MSDLLYIFIASLIFNSILFKLYISISQKYKIYDIPTSLNSHILPTPTGSGIIILISIIFTMLTMNLLNFHDINSYLPNKYYLFFFCIVCLGIMSFIDDLKSIPPPIRLIIQFTIIFFALPLLEVNDIFFSNIVKLNLITTLYIWVYLINIINFTDGSDGFLATNSLSFFMGTVAFTIITNNINIIFYISLSFIPILLSYLYFNKPQAKIFMGDSGSIIIGFSIAFIFFNLIKLGYWDVALGLLSYTILDCSLTIFNKIRKGHLPWARLFDYYFLIPIMKDKNNQKKVFLLNLVCNSIILFITIFQIFLDLKILFILSFTVSLIFVNIYKRV
jgi:UDP-N-acetylmuramyl pentapeptide phosphotransferase/UDP-N-acetylglucosamine-1-phosphate transferase